MQHKGGVYAGMFFDVTSVWLALISVTWRNLVNIFIAWNTICSAQTTHCNFILCEHIWLFVGEAHVVNWDCSPITLATSISAQEFLQY